MAKKVILKTRKNEANVDAYIKGLKPSVVSEQAKQLNSLFCQITEFEPKMWGGSIIGYGQYVYHRANGDEGEFMATGFAMRKSGPVLYIMPGYSELGTLLEKLGPHKLGKSCLYIKRLSDIDLDVLAELIGGGLEEMKSRYQVHG